MSKDKYADLREAVDESGDLSACIREWWPHPEHEGVAVVGDMDHDKGDCFPFLEIRCVKQTTNIKRAAFMLGKYLEAAHPEMVEQLLAERDALRDALERFADEVYEHADFRNGVTCPNGVIDEGAIRGAESIAAAREALKKAE